MPFVVRIPIRLVSRLYSLAIQVMTHIEISWEAQVGPGLYLPHAGCVMVTPGAVLGENVTIAPNAVIGPSFESEESASAPHVADRVYLAPGAKVLGAVEVGEDALIGANAVVMKSVPARAVVMGNPGRTVAKTGCFNVISYPGMENDPGRQKSLAEGGLGPDGKPLESPASEAASD
jgi:serine O-acetyltransferase